MARIGLIGDNSIEYIDKLLDIWNNGNCAVLIDWRVPFEVAVQMMLEADVRICFIEKRLLDKADAQSERRVQFFTYETAGMAARLLPQKIYEKYCTNYSRDEAVVIYSSGTTGMAKGAIMSHYAITTNADAIIAYMMPDRSDCIYMVKTISHLSSITGELLVALKTRMKLLVSPVVVPPRVILQNIEKYQVTKVCLNPTILKFILDEVERKTYEISSLGEIYVHGAKTNEVLGERARQFLGNCKIYFEYGLTEAGPRVASQKVNESCNASVGKPVLGVEVVIVNENGNVEKANTKGIIHVNTPGIYSGYIQGNKKLPSLYRDWLNTGDIGYLDEKDELYIVGRADDVINIGAHKIYPSDIVEQIHKCADIDECVVTMVNVHDEAVLCCLYCAVTGIREDIKKRLSNVLMKHEIPKAFIKTDSIPKTRAGKVSLKLVKDVIIKELGR